MELEYQCNRCTDSFTSKLELDTHFWLKHGISRLEAQEETDAKAYMGADAGCRQASDYLGYPSRCSSCPFKKCVLDEGRKKSRIKMRDRAILRQYRKGTSVLDLALIYRVSPRTIQRALVRSRSA